MTRVLPILIAALLLFQVNTVQAEEILLICSLDKVVQTFSDGESQAGPPASVNLDKFVIIDFAKKEIRQTGSGEVRSTAIRNMTELDDEYLLQGLENGRGWSLTLLKESGAMVAAVAGKGVAFSIQGACTEAP